MIYRRIIVIALLFALLPMKSIAASKNSRSGFIDINIYPYLHEVDDDNTITINNGASLPNRFSYFGFINIANQQGRDELEDTNIYYTEQNLRWQITPSSPFDLTFQSVLLSGDGNDVHRLGVRWRLNNTEGLSSFFKAIHLAWSVNLHPIQFDTKDAYIWQIEHVFRMNFPWLSKRLYLAGFIDHTFNQDLPENFPSNPIIGEAQLGFRVIDNFYITGEYRINQLRRSDVNNFAAGLEYVIKW